ncbi:uncharacterized protein [Nothobranchius furzeri]|uniref:uncharacterized protein isoform X1 n=1 Tax=Nothobranchius furzeri TaxID=105023 RepID=UPI0039049CCF
MWDLTVVLRGLSEASFEPLDQASLKFLSLKTALLLALASVKRVNDLTALSVAPACLRIREDGGSAVFCPNPAFVPKNINTSFKSRSISLAGLFPPPHNSDEEAASHLLCPVHALTRYVSRTSGICRSQSLFVHYRDSSLGQALSTQHLSHWLCDAISLAYTSSGRDPPETLRAHSARGISSSMALHSGVSIDGRHFSGCFMGFPMSLYSLLFMRCVFRFHQSFSAWTSGRLSESIMAPHQPYLNEFHPLVDDDFSGGPTLISGCLILLSPRLRLSGPL